MNTPRIIKARASGRLSTTAILAAARVLRRGGLVVAPTDTVYGLAADPAAPGATAKLQAAKGRSSKKPVPLLSESLEQIEGTGIQLRPTERILAKCFWPGPLTLVLQVGRSTEGFRVPQHPVMLALLKAIGRPLRVTSANRSGSPAPKTFAEAMMDLANVVDMGLEDEPAPLGISSTVVQVDVKNRIKIIKRI